MIKLVHIYLKKVIAISSTVSSSVFLVRSSVDLFERIDVNFGISKDMLSGVKLILVQFVKEQNILDFSDKDLLFLSVLICKNPTEDHASIFEKLKKTFNGYMAPIGEQFVLAFTKEPIEIDKLSTSSLNLFRDIKKAFAPFKVSLLFEDLKLIVTGNLLNLFPRVEPKSGLETLRKMRLDLSLWAKEIGVSGIQLESIAKGDFAKLAWLATPFMDAKDYQDILLYSKYLTLLFLHDDDGDNQTSVSDVEKVREITERNRLLNRIFKKENDAKDRLNTDPIIKAAFEIIDRVDAIQKECKLLGKVVNVSFFERSNEEYLHESTKESGDVQRGTIIDEPTYLGDRRPKVSALHPCFSLSAILQRINVSNDDLASNPTKVFVQKGNTHVSLANDVISPPKEIDQKAYSLFQIRLMEKAKSIGAQIDPGQVFITKTDLLEINGLDPDMIPMTVSEVINTINTTMRGYHQIVVNEGTTEFEEKVVRPWMAGNGDWQEKTERYAKKLGIEGTLESNVQQLKALGYRVVCLS